MRECIVECVQKNTRALSKKSPFQEPETGNEFRVKVIYGYLIQEQVTWEKLARSTDNDIDNEYQLPEELVCSVWLDQPVQVQEVISYALGYRIIQGRQLDMSLIQALGALELFPFLFRSRATMKYHWANHRSS